MLRRRWPRCSRLFAPAPLARADIFQWEYINPANPSLGKQQSTTLAPDGAGANAVPGANLSNRNLTMAYLIGADLSVISFTMSTVSHYYYANLTDANLSQANLTNANLIGATLTGANLTGAEVRGRTSIAIYYGGITAGPALLDGQLPGPRFDRNRLGRQQPCRREPRRPEPHECELRLAPR